MGMNALPYGDRVDFLIYFNYGKDRIDLVSCLGSLFAPWLSCHKAHNTRLTYHAIKLDLFSKSRCCVVVSSSIIISLNYNKSINTKNFNYSNKKIEIIDRCQM